MDFSGATRIIVFISFTLASGSMYLRKNSCKITVFPTPGGAFNNLLFFANFCDISDEICDYISDEICDDISDEIIEKESNSSLNSLSELRDSSVNSPTESSRDSLLY